jgi:hypothetical protein
MNKPSKEGCFKRSQLIRLRALLGCPDPQELPPFAQIVVPGVLLTNALVLELNSYAAMSQLSKSSKPVADLLWSWSVVLQHGLPVAQNRTKELRQLEKTFTNKTKSGQYWAPLDEVGLPSTMTIHDVSYSLLSVVPKYTPLHRLAGAPCTGVTTPRSYVHS